MRISEYRGRPMPSEPAAKQSAVSTPKSAAM
jgi:hypothetical protein